MMIFLINYDRHLGALVSIEEYSDKERAKATQAKLQLEIDLLSKSGQYEVVLLEAPSRESLQITHRRYFASFEDMKTQEKRS